jgi:hypothetical protein
MFIEWTFELASFLGSLLYYHSADSCLCHVYFVSTFDSWRFTKRFFWWYTYNQRERESHRETHRETLSALKECSFWLFFTNGYEYEMKDPTVWLRTNHKFLEQHQNNLIIRPHTNPTKIQYNTFKSTLLLLLLLLLLLDFIHSSKQ